MSRVQRVIALVTPIAFVAGGVHAQTIWEIAPVVGADLGYQGTIEEPDGRLRTFRLPGTRLLVPDDVVVKDVKALGQRGPRQGVTDVSKAVQAGASEVAPLPQPAEVTVPELGPGATPVEPEPSEPEQPFVQIVDYKPDWTRLVAVSLGVGTRSETTSGKGGVSWFEADNAAIPIVLTIENPVVAKEPWRFGLELAQATYREKASETSEEAGASQRDAKAGYERQTAFMRYDFGTDFSLPQGHGLLAGTYLIFGHARMLEPADPISGLAKVARRHYTAVGFEVGYQLSFGAFGLTGLLGHTPDLTTFARKGELTDVGVRGDYFIDEETWIYVRGSWRHGDWRTRFPCPEGSECRKAGTTQTVATDILLGVGTNVYAP